MRKVYYEEQPMTFAKIGVGDYFRIDGILFLKLSEYEAVPDEFIASMSQYDEVDSLERIEQIFQATKNGEMLCE